MARARQGAAIESAVDALRTDGKGFSLTLTTLQHRHVAVEGRAIGGRAVLRIKDLTGAQERTRRACRRSPAAAPRHRYGRAACSRRCPSPVWARDAAGRLTWVNAAYARAVEARDGARCGRAQPRDPRSRGARRRRARARAGEFFEARLPVIVAGTRRIFQVIDRPSPGGSAGIGIDVTEVEAMRAEIARMTEAHRRTLDQLATGVAIFTADQRLDVLQRGVPGVVGPRAGVPRFAADRLGGARPAARGAQASRAGRLPQLEERAARSLPGARAAPARMAPARRAHACASSPRQTRKAASPICSTT